MRTKQCNNLLRKQRGFGIIETIVAVSILIIIAATATTTVLHSFSLNRLGDEETEATLFAQEGIEAARSIRNQAWLNLDTGSGTCVNSLNRGVDNSGGFWSWATSPQTSGKFTRTINIANICRNDSGDIDEAGTIYDEDIKKVTSTVTWQFSAGRSNTVSLITYLSQWDKTIGVTACDWSYPPIAGSFDFPTNNDAIKVQSKGNYAYVTIDDVGNPPYDFAVLDVSNPENPSLAGSLSLAGTPMNISLSGNYAYIASSDNSEELQIIDISNPFLPVARGSFDTAGSQDAMGVYAHGSTVYLVKKGDNSADEFFIINASNPDSPTLTGSANLGNNNRGGLEVYTSGNYAYIASEDQNKELKIVDISNPASPNYLSAGSYDVSGNQNALTVTGFDNTVIIGVDDDYLYFLNVSNPLNVSLISSYQTDDDVNDIAIGESNHSVFEASNNNVNDEFQVVDISDIENPASLGSFDAQNPLLGVAFDGLSCAVYAVGAPNVNPEFLVIRPGAAPTPSPSPSASPSPSPSPTATPSPSPTPATCNQYCQQQYGLPGSCIKKKDCGGYDEGNIYECSPPNICCCQ